LNVINPTKTVLVDGLLMRRWIAAMSINRYDLPSALLNEN